MKKRQWVSMGSAIFLIGGFSLVGIFAGKDVVHGSINMVIRERAESTNNIALCERMLWSHDEVFQCQQTIIRRFDNPEYCLQSVYPLSCLDYMASEKKDMSICFKIKKYFETSRYDPKRFPVARDQTAAETILTAHQKCIAQNARYWSDDIQICNTLSVQYWHDQCIENYRRGHQKEPNE